MLTAKLSSFLWTTIDNRSLSKRESHSYLGFGVTPRIYLEINFHWSHDLHHIWRLSLSSSEGRNELFLNVSLSYYIAQSLVPSKASQSQRFLRNSICRASQKAFVAFQKKIVCCASILSSFFDNFLSSLSRPKETDLFKRCRQDVITPFSSAPAALVEAEKRAVEAC